MYSFKKMVAHDQAYRVNFQNIGGARAPDAPSMMSAPADLCRHIREKIK